MIFHTQGTKFNYIPNITINGTSIERVSDFVFLGLTVNEKLSWKSHVDKIANKLSKYSGVLCRLKHFLPSHILRMIYCSIIQSNLNFSLLTWGFDCNRLIKLQKKIIRIITCSKYNAHTEPLFKRLELLKLTDMITLNTLKFYWKLNKDKVPDYFVSYKPQTREALHGRDTRNNQLISRNNIRIATQEKCLRNYLPEVLNSTKDKILEKVHTHSYDGFSNYAKLCIIKDYSLECTVQNCYICSQPN